MSSVFCQIVCRLFVRLCLDLSITSLLMTVCSQFKFILGSLSPLPPSPTPPKKRWSCKVGRGPEFLLSGMWLLLFAKYVGTTSAFASNFDSALQICWGGGGLNWPCDTCLHNDNTALMKEISLFPIVSVQNWKNINCWPIRRSKQIHGVNNPPPPPPILLRSILPQYN